jgi:hypothetical protein
MRLRESRALRALRGTLPDGLRERCDVLETIDHPVLLLHLPGGEVSELVPIWIGEGFPRDVIDALARGYSDSLADSQTRVLVARRMSIGAKRLLENQHISWADETGRAHLAVPPNLYILRETPAGPRAEDRAHDDLRWGESTGAVAETILTRLDHSDSDNPFLLSSGEPARLPNTAELADDADWSTAQVGKVLQQFDTVGWTAKTGAERGTTAGRILVDPGGLLSGWAAWHRSRRLPSTGAHALVRDPRELLESLEQTDVGPWAVTGWLALEDLAPYSTSTPNISCYLDASTYDERLFDLMGDLHLRPVTEGARITFLRAEPHVIRQSSISRGPYPVVSAVRLYGDLLRQGVRGEAAAEHLREVSLGF